jgi:hypothetical protein
MHPHQLDSRAACSTGKQLLICILHINQHEPNNHCGAASAHAAQAWVLDTLPGEVRAGGPGRADHPADLIAALRRIPLPIADRNGVLDYLTQSGVHCWVAALARAAAAADLSPGIHCEHASSSSAPPDACINASKQLQLHQL